MDNVLIGLITGWEVIQSVMLAYILIGIWRLRHER